jgi:hypothetical protein
MSGINGDKARFNKQRKMKIYRRAQKRAMLGLQGTSINDARIRRSQTKTVEVKSA